MKIRKLIESTAIMLLLPMAVTSCLGKNSDDEMKVTTTYSSFFNAITDPETGEMLYFPGVSYTLETQMDKAVASLKIEGLRLPNGASYPSMIFVDAPWKTNSRGWAELSLTNAVPEGVGGFALAPTFSSLMFQTVNRYFSSLYVPCVSIQYDVDGYRVHSFNEQILEVGETEVVDKTTGDIYKPNENNIDPAVYLFTLSPTTRKATLNIAGAKFHKDMPAMNMRFSDIPFEVDYSGNILMKMDNLVPSLLTGNNLSTATATPMPSFPISGFTATFDPDRGLWVSYVCSPDMERFKGEFAVTMINKYPDSLSGSSSSTNSSSANTSFTN